MTATPSLQPAVVPAALEPGSRVAIVASAGPVLASRLQPGVAALRDAGLVVEMRDDVARGQGTYLAGDDATRLAELVAALDDDGVEAIVVVRGGYGTMRLLEGLEAAFVERGARWRPKRLAGFSDVTALHAFWATRLGWAALHTPMPFNLGGAGRGEARSVVDLSAAELVEALMSPTPSVGLAPLPPLIPVVGGRARGVMIGGNMSLVESIYRSPWLPTLEGALLFVEDVGEALYRLDRLVTALRLRGAHREVRGVVVGDFADCGTSPDAAASHVGELFSDWGVPVARGLDAGHRHPNRAIWAGCLHELDVDRGTLSVVVEGGGES